MTKIPLHGGGAGGPLKLEQRQLAATAVGHSSYIRPNVHSVDTVEISN